MQHSQCKCHPGEERCLEFDALDELIRLGWGSVPQPEIERIRRRNGGVLPDVAPADAEGDDFSEWAKSQLETRRATQTDVVMAAVEAGFSNSTRIAEVTGMPRKTVAGRLAVLCQRGRIERCGSVSVAPGVERYAYRVAETPPEPKAEQHEPTQSGLILDAVRAGYGTAMEVAVVTGFSAKRTGSGLSYLLSLGLIERCGQTMNPQGMVIYVYRAVEARAA